MGVRSEDGVLGTEWLITPSVCRQHNATCMTYMFLGKVTALGVLCCFALFGSFFTALGVLCCFALFVCLTLLASFFLPSHLSFKNMYITIIMTLHYLYMYMYMHVLYMY